ncbi:FMN-binding glutamate synthase family protein [Pseudomonas luteola]
MYKTKIVHYKTNFTAWYACLGLLLFSLILSLYSCWFLILTLVTATLFCVGLRDLSQTNHSVLRNYPVIGHLRYFLEYIRPEIRQYFLEGDEEQLPFSRAQRSLVYARAKNEPAEKAFGSLKKMYEPGYEFIGHAMIPTGHLDPNDFRIVIGGKDCVHPYSASIFNISAMSFGSLSANAIQALNAGAFKGGFAHDTGEGSISEYHRLHNGDLIWEIGSGYFGCRDDQGRFDAAMFAEQAKTEQVKMIEIKLSQGAKPGHGGILPAAKVTNEIASTRKVPVGQDCISPASHSEFSNPIEMMGFIQRLRDLSGGKPVGFKLCIGHPWEFMSIVKAMLKTGIRPDFIVVDGSEGGTGAAPREFTDHIGMPLREGLLFVHNTLVGAGLRDEVKIGASGKIISAFDIASVMALGADWVNSARGFMFALGCLMSGECSTGKCVTGVATQDPDRQKALNVEDKAERVYSFHRNTLITLSEILSSSGLKHPADIKAEHLVRRVSATEIRLFSELHHFVDKDEFLRGYIKSDFYRSMWARASADSFA